jgi:hypothetical protein
MPGNIRQSSGVDRGVRRKAPGDDGGGVGAQRHQLVPRERGGRADHVAAEADGGRALQGQQVRADHVLQVHPAVEQLVHLHVPVGVGVADLGAAGRLREEPRGPEHEAGQAFGTCGPPRMDELSTR